MLRSGSKHRAHTAVVGPGLPSRSGLLKVFGRDPDEKGLSGQPADGCNGKVGLADVNTVGAGGEGDVSAIVNYDTYAGVGEAAESDGAA